METPSKEEYAKAKKVVDKYQDAYYKDFCNKMRRLDEDIDEYLKNNVSGYKRESTQRKGEVEISFTDDKISNDLLKIGEKYGVKPRINFFVYIDNK